MRKKKRESPRTPYRMVDPFEAAINAKTKVRGETGFIFDQTMAEHSNPWDPEHIERPERILRAKERCNQLQFHAAS